MGHRYSMDGKCAECGKYTDYFCDACTNFVCDNHRVKKDIKSSSEHHYLCKSCAKKGKKTKYGREGQMLKDECC